MSPSPRNKKCEQGSAGSGQSKKDGAQSRRSVPHTRPIVITPQVLRRLPLPQPKEEGDKEERGRVLVIGGGQEMPGAIILAATAALRAGAGKLQIATGKSIAPLVAASVPESRVFALPETKSGAVANTAVSKVGEYISKVQAVCIGPGWIDETAVKRFVKGMLQHCKNMPVILDAGALACLSEGRELLHALEGRAIITPHAEEMATIYSADKEEIVRDPFAAAYRAASELRAVVALKGRETFIAEPDGDVYCNRAGNIGLATSGSGDTLSGIIAGLSARGAEPLTATVWGVYLHACAGDRLAERIGPLGFLARELLPEIPSLMSELSGNKKR